MACHAEFLADMTSCPDRWRVRSLGVALRAAYGMRAPLKYRLAVWGVLLPLLAYTAYAAWGRRGDLLWWVGLGWFAGRAASPRPTAVGLLSCLGLFCTGGVASAVCNDPLHVLGGLLPGITWFPLCAVQGMSTLQLREDLQRSAELFDKLQAARVLTTTTTPLGAAKPAN